MMEDPKRLLSVHGGATALERDLLEHVPSMRPPEGEKARAWEALAAQLATATLVGTSVTTAKAATAVTKASLSKGLLGPKIIAVVVASGLTAGGGIWALSPAEDTATQPQNSPVVAAQAKRGVRETVAERQAEPSDELAESASAEEAVSPKPRKLTALKRKEALLRESSLLKRARAQLRAGDHTAAQGSLERLASEFPDGVLGQEREVLAIAILSAQGQVERARTRARAFVKAHPRSPHSAALQGLLETQ